MRGLPELPLLRRELTELANRRRTYVVRVLGACVILFVVFIAYQQVMDVRMSNAGGFAGRSNRFQGVGGEVFARITPVLFWSIQILMPALCCACITSEKESNTIGTLLLTRLSPGTIIVEKFFSRLVPMLTLLLLTFPILAHVYSMGGVDTDVLIGTLWLLLCECVLFASIAILCSAWFTTTVAAFTVSYALTGLLAAMSLSLELRMLVPSAIWRSVYVYNLQDTAGWTEVPAAFLAGLLSPLERVGIPVAGSIWLMIVVRSVPALLLTAVGLLLSRLLLVRRAFISHSSVLMKVFRKVDRFFQELNDRTTGGIELIKDSDTLPGDDPVVWREKSKKSLGKARYLFRILVAIEGPTLFICMMAATLSARNAFEGLYFLEGLIWIFSALVVTVKGATLFSSERANQTIEPLLATPMTANEMLDQKVAGINRLLIVLAVPIMTVHFTHFVLHVNFSIATFLSPAVLRPLCYLCLGTGGTFLLLYLVSWISAGIGLKVHSQTKAVLTSVMMIGLWVVTPLVLIGTFGRHLGFMGRNVAILFSPVSVVSFLESWLWEIYGQTYYDPETREPFEPWYVLWTLAALAGYTVILVGIRLAVKRLGPRLLGRRETLPTVSYDEPQQVMALEGVRT